MSAVTLCTMEEEYEKNKNVKQENIQKLREWVTTQDHLPHEHITDMDLVLAYHSCELDMEQTKKGLDLNYTLRTMFTFYQDREINDTLKRALNCWLVTPLTTLTNKGCRPIYCQLLDPNPSEFVYSDVVKAFVMIIDLCLHEEGTVPGIAVLLNMDKVSLSHVSRVDLTVAQQFFYFLQLVANSGDGVFRPPKRPPSWLNDLKAGTDYLTCPPKHGRDKFYEFYRRDRVVMEAMFVRLREFHFINAPSFMDKLMSMFRPFMKEDMLEIVHSHPTGSNSLNEYLPIAALPKDAGGENSESTILKDKIWSKITANEDFFKDDSKKIVDESKRPGGPKTMSTFFPSLEGSFKKLQID